MSSIIEAIRKIWHILICEYRISLIKFNISPSRIVFDKLFSFALGTSRCAAFGSVRRDASKFKSWGSQLEKMLDAIFTWPNTTRPQYYVYGHNIYVAQCWSIIWACFKFVSYFMCIMYTCFLFSFYVIIKLEGY